MTRRITMYGAAIETDFQHIHFESAQRQRKLEMRRLFETGELPHRPSRSLAQLLRRAVPRLELRAPAGRSPIVPG
jgi:hypothetical protein